MGCQTQSNFPAPLANFLSPSELISNLFAWVFQLWIALVSNMGVLGLNISAYRCGQLCTVLALICAFVKISANWNLRGSLYILYRQQRSQHWDKNTKIQVITVVTHAIACNSALFSSWSKQWGSHQENKFVERKRDRWLEESLAL